MSQLTIMLKEQNQEVFDIINNSKCLASTGLRESWSFLLRGSRAELNEVVKLIQDHPAIYAAYHCNNPDIFFPDPPAYLALKSNLVARIFSSNITPNFSSRQGYLKPAPEGIDTNFAWSQSGGKGNSINIFDIEFGWLLTHEDLKVKHAGGSFLMINVIAIMGQLLQVLSAELITSMVYAEYVRKLI